MKYFHTILAALLTVMGATTATARSRDIPTDRDPSGARTVVSLLRPAIPESSGADTPTTGANTPAASALPALAAIKSSIEVSQV